MLVHLYSIGVFEEKEKDEEAETKKRKHEEDAGVELASVFGMKVKALNKDGELRALEYGKSEAVDPSKVDGYLKRAFRDRLGPHQSDQHTAET